MGMLRLFFRLALILQASEQNLESLRFPSMAAPQFSQRPTPNFFVDCHSLGKNGSRHSREQKTLPCGSFLKAKRQISMIRFPQEAQFSWTFTGAPLGEFRKVG